jgi:catechol 2,3-dioxygenase-like lactoylglutathione lyase family enzyme
MAKITRVGRVMVPVHDQDEAIAFYTRTLGFTLTADVPFGGGDRWVEVTPADGGAALALVRPQGDYQPGRMTGIALSTTDVRADHAELTGKGVDTDAEMMGGGADGVPLMFFFRDISKNHLMMVEEA